MKAIVQLITPCCGVERGEGVLRWARVGGDGTSLGRWRQREDGRKEG